MPIENERKFVLSPPFDDLEKQVSKAASKAIQIEQAYMLRKKEMTVRVRGSTSLGELPILPWYELNVKRIVRGETVEVETKISKEDFLKLWSVSTGRLRKIRYVIGKLPYC